ncbi:MAG: hypothetical protein CMK70_10075 [Pseudohongiella sp.]|nr:hypothetical protein [Pseudohongiella sp.]
MRDKRHQGVMPCLVLALHTWGRQLNLHPHIHAVVTAGGIDAFVQWKDRVSICFPFARSRRCTGVSRRRS